MNEELVEQVARAICRYTSQRDNEVIHGSGWASSDGRGGSTVTQYAWQKHLPAARAIIPLVLEAAAKRVETVQICVSPGIQPKGYGEVRKFFATAIRQLTGASDE